LLLVAESGARSARLGRRARPVSRRQREEGSSPVVRDEILTTEEVCTLLKIKKATLYRHTSQGTGPPFYKIGKHTKAIISFWTELPLCGIIRTWQGGVAVHSRKNGFMRSD
jgi:excisionase family DNA binding protein